MDETIKPKIVLGTFIVVLITGILVSGSYIVNYFNWFTKEEIVVVSPENPSESDLESKDNQSSIEETIPVTTNENVTESQEVESKEKIYSQDDLDELKSYIKTLHFEPDSNTLTSESITLVEGIALTLLKYPNEKITIQSYVNGYPSFEKSTKANELSELRGNTILALFSNKGIAAERFNVYNFGAEVSLYKEEHRQYENDRVNVFFTDHYVALPASK